MPIITMAEAIRQRVTKIQEGAKAKRKLAGWILPKQKASFGEEDDWWVLKVVCVQSN